MQDYRDDTLSFDKYEVLEIEPMPVQGPPTRRDVYTYHLRFHTVTIAAVAAEAFKLVECLTVYCPPESDSVTLVAVGEEAMVAEAMAWGYVARGFTSEAVWRNVSANGPFNEIEV